MPDQNKAEKLFHEYFIEWVELYKVDAVKKITLNKYFTTHKWLKTNASELKMCELNRATYQKLINLYAKEHAKLTTKNFHAQLKSSIIDALEDGVIEKNPTKKVVIKGQAVESSKVKFLNQEELKKLIDQLDLCDITSWDWIIFIGIKTGLRFSEIIALTPNDFDFENCLINVDKTWNYKEQNGGFQDTKNASSIRKVQIDEVFALKIKKQLLDFGKSELIFLKNRSRIFNSTVNDRLNSLCLRAGIPVITMHALRHTHASLLIFSGVSIATVSKRLGHSTISTTQETYLHIIKEMEMADREKITNLLKILS